MNELPSLTIAIPAFNEAQNLSVILPSLCETCRQQQWKIVVINDGSSDNTREVLKSFQEPGFFSVVHHKVNKGYGAALKSGIMASDTVYVITMDADGQHSVEDVAKLFACLKKNDADLV